jgi:ABC-2 type transport system ATP-binding protein
MCIFGEIGSAMSLDIKNISKHFGSQKALSGVSFKVKKGEIVGFLGPNGAGKSTLMKILTTYLSADEGQAFVNGHDVAKAPRAVQKCIGYLPEHNPLYPELYVKDYLEYHANVYKVPKAKVPTVIENTGLQLESHKRIGQLSKGYRQRVGLAAALLHDPEVLILDEPTTGLDPNQLLEIRKLIRKIGKTKTILLSTHIMKEVEAVCDRVLIINKGVLVADKKLKELRADRDQVIEVEFDYRVEEVLLQGLPSVTGVRNTGGFIYEITFNTDKDMRPVVFDFAHDHKLKTLQLSRKNKNLENLFSELTR